MPKEDYSLEFENEKNPFFWVTSSSAGQAAETHIKTKNRQQTFTRRIMGLSVTLII